MRVFMKQIGFCFISKPTARWSGSPVVYWFFSLFTCRQLILTENNNKIKFVVKFNVNKKLAALEGKKMSSVTKVIKSVGPKLVPFFKTVAIYFVIFLPTDKPSIFSTVLKCLPTLSLMLFVLLHGMSFGDEYKYSRRILIGLLFGCIGDACLIWPNYFEFGMIAFAIGHFHYILAFGFKPLNPVLGVVLAIACGFGILYLMPGLHGILIPGVPIYTAIITLMIWRGIARVQFFEELWTWSKLCSCIGAILFGVSDFILGVHMFKYKVEHAQVLVMSTYYAAQLGIALSVVDSKSSTRTKID